MFGLGRFALGIVLDVIVVIVTRERKRMNMNYLSTVPVLNLCDRCGSLMGTNVEIGDIDETGFSVYPCSDLRGSHCSSFAEICRR